MGLTEDWRTYEEKVCECEGIAIEIMHPKAQRIGGWWWRVVNTVSATCGTIYNCSLIFLKRRKEEMGRKQKIILEQIIKIFPVLLKTVMSQI